jgi:mannobiose 2-epimerase
MMVQRAASRTAAPVDAEAISEQVTASRTRLERLLVENVLPFWCDRIVAENGGYHLNHDRAGRSLGAAPQQLCAQARALWFYSRLGRTRWGSTEHAAIARHGFRFLADRMWDTRWGGFFWEVSPTGDPTKTQKETLAQAYGLFALAEFARGTGDPAAAAMVSDLWRLVDGHCHDAVHGGYVELRCDDWSGADDFVGPFTRAPRDKTLAVQLHVLEALTTCVDASNDVHAETAERLLELILLLAASTASTSERPGHERFCGDWGPHNGSMRQSYGHDAELIWMLHDAWDVLGQPMPPLAPVLRERFDEVLRLGFDQRHGGFYREGPAGRHADDTTKEYWAQAEGLLAALRLHALTGDARYGFCYLRTLDWIEQRQVDWVGGDWFERIDERGRPAGVKASPWKEPYHHGRALIECLESLDRAETTTTFRRC